jgi:hypothetical protein
MAALIDADDSDELLELAEDMADIRAAVVLVLRVGHRREISRAAG